MSKVIMTKGLPCSGKSYWAKEQVQKGGCIRVSMDDIRESVFGGWSVKKEKACLRLRDTMVRYGIRESKNVIVDATNLNPKHEIRLRKLADAIGADFEVEDSFLQKTPEECITADLHRGKDAVGADVIWDMYYRWIAPDPIKKLSRDFDKPRAVICDIDGVLALNLEGRSYHDESRMSMDKIDPFMGCILDSLANYGYELDGEKYPSIILVSGRSESAREVTEDWLDRNAIEYDMLLMRQEGDIRRDDIVKEEIYLNQVEPYYAVLGAFDDSIRCCRMWRKCGLRVAQIGDYGKGTR